MTPSISPGARKQEIAIRTPNQTQEGGLQTHEKNPRIDLKEIKCGES